MPEDRHQHFSDTEIVTFPELLYVIVETQAT